MTLLLFALGLVALIAGAELLVRGASKLALSFGISPLVVGLTIVAFGTSSPELAVSVQSAWNGQTDMAVANVVGSNIFNVLFILGLSAMITPLLASAWVAWVLSPALLVLVAPVLGSLVAPVLVPGEVVQASGSAARSVRNGLEVGMRLRVRTGHLSGARRRASLRRSVAAR